MRNIKEIITIESDNKIDFEDRINALLDDDHTVLSCNVTICSPNDNYFTSYTAIIGKEKS
jgi:hypothetical protein